MKNTVDGMLNTYLSILHLLSGNKTKYTKNTKLSDLVSEDFDYIDFLLSVISLETTYKIAMPKDITDDLDITVEQFVKKMSKLPEETDKLFITKQFIKLTGYLEKMMNVQNELENQPDEAGDI